VAYAATNSLSGSGLGECSNPIYVSFYMVGQGRCDQTMRRPLKTKTQAVPRLWAGDGLFRRYTDAKLAQRSRGSRNGRTGARQKANLLGRQQAPAGSGSPPHIDGDTRGRYHGYFENEYGEQALFVYDYETQTSTLWMGDGGWEKPSPVVEGVARGFLLDEAQALWLRACWLAATTRLLMSTPTYWKHCIQHARNAV
jgi:hypothetical protein